MNVIVDTGVIACYLLGAEPYVDDLSRFWRVVTATAAPAVWEAELANVVWMAVRSGVLAADRAPHRLALAGQLGIRSVPVRRLWRGATIRAVRSGLAVYDMLFVELAVRERVKLATYDARLLAAFPDLARSPESLMPA